MNPTLFQRLRSVYLATAVLVLNTIVFLLIVNAVLYGAFYVRDSMAHSGEPKKPTPPQRPPDNGKLFNSDGSPAQSGKRNNYQLDWIDYGAYEGMSQTAASEVLDDFYEHGRLGFAFQPWVQFSEPEFSGKFLHIDDDAHGFPIRRTVNPKGERTPVAQVFVLGGSTTLGVHVSDEQTWPSYLSAILNKKASGKRIQIVNYGHEFFNPSQEAVLLADLLKSGHRPSLVIFMDGVNEPTPTDVPHWTNDLRQAFHATQFPPSFAERMSWIPMFRLVDFFQRRWRGAEPTVRTVPDPPTHTEKHIHTAINGFRQSRDISRAIAGLYDVPTLFFLQPNAFYNYDLKLYRLTTIPEWFLEYRRFMKPVYDQLKSDRAYIDLSGMLDEWGHRKAMIDDVHYSPAFNQFLAERVSQSIDVQALQPRSPSEDSATGASR